MCYNMVADGYVCIAITVYRKKKIWVKKAPKPAYITLHCVVCWWYIVHTYVCCVV